MCCPYAYSRLGLLGHRFTELFCKGDTGFFWSQILVGMNTHCPFFLRSLCNSPVNPLCWSFACNFSVEVTVLFPNRTPHSLRSVLAQWLEQGSYCLEQWVQKHRVNIHFVAPIPEQIFPMYIMHLLQTQRGELANCRRYLLPLRFGHSILGEYRMFFSFFI